MTSTKIYRRIWILSNQILLLIDGEVKSEYFYPSNISKHLVIATLHSYFYELSELSCSVLISGVAGKCQSAAASELCCCDYHLTFVFISETKQDSLHTLTLLF